MAELCRGATIPLRDLSRGVQVAIGNHLADHALRAVAAGEGVGVLLVDREGPWRSELSAYLEAEGFEVLHAEEAEAAEALLHDARVDLVVQQMSGLARGGLSLCRRLSARDGAPVILVSGQDREIDRIIGLEVGADDFVSQSCSHRELLARIRAVLRRQVRRGLTDNSGPDGDRASIRFAGWTLSPGRLEVQSPQGRRAQLAPSDFKLLSALLQSPGETITRERLARLVGLCDPKLRSLDVGVSRLRGKLGPASDGGPLIRTVRGVGYLLHCPTVVEGPHGSDPWERKAAG